MLSDEVIDKVIERLVNRIDSANEYILKEIGRSIKQLGTINPTKANQLVQMLKYGGDYDKIIKELSRITQLNIRDIEEIFEEVAKSDVRFAKQFFDYRNKQYIPYEKNIFLQNQVKTLARATAEEYINITKTSALGFGFVDSKGGITIKGLQEAYNDMLDEAVVSMMQGKETFDGAMYRQLQNIGESGLKVIYPTTYIGKDGIERHHTMRLDSAVRMNMETALKQLHNEMGNQLGEQFGADGVELSVHEFPAEDHAEAQGKQFSKEEFEKLQTDGIATTYDKKHIDLHLTLKSGASADYFRPISDYNCRHNAFPIVLGVTKQIRSNKELKEIKERNEKGFEYNGKHYTLYEGTQIQRRLETEIRKQKDVQIAAKAADNKDLIRDAQGKIKVLNKRYRELCDISGLEPKINRMKVLGYKREKTS